MCSELNQSAPEKPRLQWDQDFTMFDPLRRRRVRCDPISAAINYSENVHSPFPQVVVSIQSIFEKKTVISKHEDLPTLLKKINLLFVKHV
ncbi:unnamed protein product [Caretta caretta]